ncbi:hypothetical protein H5T51_00445, partial [Candidatus Bathyarchaeota archaeon]|nr:hypothetical protein [Candidatus Bathyarchaeota archaeon]
FSSEKQFINKKFDYCILIAAKKDRAYPQHIFVIKCEEMTTAEMGNERKSSVYTGGSFFIEFSYTRDFYFKRKGWPHGFSPLEEKLFKSREVYQKRWNQLKKNGILE